MLPLNVGRDGSLGSGALGLLAFGALFELYVCGRGFASKADPEDADVPFALEASEILANPRLKEESSSGEAVCPGCSFCPLNPACCAMSSIGRKSIRGRISLSIPRQLTNS